MKSKKLMTSMGLSFLVLLLMVLAAGNMLVSCTAQNIPTGPPTPTFTPTRTLVSTNTPTWTMTGTLVVTATPTITATPLYGLGPGSVAFTAFLTNGNGQQAFIPLVPLNAGTTIYLTNMAWDDSGYSGMGVTANTGATGGFQSAYTGAYSAGTSMSPELILQYVSGSSVPADTTLFSWSNRAGNVAGSAAQMGPGDTFTGIPTSLGVTYILDSANVTGDKLIAFTSPNVDPNTGAISSPVVFLGAVIWGPDTWTPSGTSPANYYDSVRPPGLNSTNSIDLSTKFNSNTA
ncbi:MAG TPA: hypothetical protein VIJ93_06590, partial [bacterium]